MLKLKASTKTKSQPKSKFAKVSSEYIMPVKIAHPNSKDDSDINVDGPKSKASAKMVNSRPKANTTKVRSKHVPLVIFFDPNSKDSNRTEAMRFDRYVFSRAPVTALQCSHWIG